MPSSRFLLISRVGRDGLHSAWLEPAAKRGFDVLLSAYDRSVEARKGEGVHFEYREGSKVAGYGAILADHADLLARYDFVALFDDDLLIDAEALTRLFTIVASYRLKIAQPALDHESFYTYASLLEHKAFQLRFVTYVEMMCPIFRTDVLMAIAPLFGMGFESGIDLIWSGLTHETPRDFAVIDAVTVRHTRRVGTAKAANGFGEGRAYEHDIHRILGLFGLPWWPSLPYAAIRHDGSATRNRFELILAAMRLTASMPIRFSWKWRVRPVLVYWNHLIRRKPRNARATWPANLPHSS